MIAPAATDSPSFVDFHAARLAPELASRSTGLPPAYAQTLRPFGIRERETGQTVTYRYAPESGRIEIARGDESAATVIELSNESFIRLTQDLESAPGLLYGEQASRVRGDMMDFLQWEPALRWMYCSRPVYDPDSVDLRDANGRTRRRPGVLVGQAPRRILRVMPNPSRRQRTQDAIASWRSPTRTLRRVMRCAYEPSPGSRRSRWGHRPLEATWRRRGPRRPPMAS